MSTTDIKANQDRVLEKLRGLKIDYVTDAAPTQSAFSSYHEAAAVLATFDLASLNPVNGIRDDSALDALERDCVIVKDVSNTNCDEPDGSVARKTLSAQNVGVAARLMLRRDTRIQVLKQLNSRQALQRALSANPERRQTFKQKILEAYIRGNAPPLETQSACEIAATLEVCDWLGDILEGLPPLDQVRARNEWYSLLQPFELISGRHFRGRQKELQLLRDYVGVLPPGTFIGTLSRIAEQIFDLANKPPLVIHGPGGRGKSALVAKFILEHATLPDTEKFPWAYLDFDRTAIQPEEPLTLLLDAVRQLGIQYPATRVYCDRIFSKWQQELGRRAEQIKRAARSTKGESSALYSTEQDWEGYCENFGNLLAQLKVETAPFLMVLDTFEVVQYRSPVIVASLLRFLSVFQKHVPRLRTVLSGRAPLGDSSDFAKFPREPLPLDIFDREAAQGFLEANGVPPATAKEIAERVKGSPLNLKLALDLWSDWKRHPADSELMDAFRFRAELDEAQQQGVLFGRILDRINDPDVRKIAHPGLVLRRVTAKLIEEVLAAPCGVKLQDPNHAERIFEELEREVFLVQIKTEDGHETLVHREDVRREMIRLLRAEQIEKVKLIEQAAVAYYEPKPSPLARAEEIYHRLSLKQDANALEPRWQQVTESKWLDDEAFKKNMLSALEEFELGEQEWLAQIAWLAPRLGRSLSPGQRALADLQAWERDTAQRVSELLVRRQWDLALSALRERQERTPASPLFRLEIQLLERKSRWQEALQVIERGIPSALAGRDLGLATDLTIRAANVNIQLKEFDKARALLDEAERLSQNDGALPQRIIALKLTHLDLNRVTRTGDADSLELKRELVELFARLSDEQVIADPLLMQQFAFYLTEQDRQVLRRIVRLNGLGTSRQNSLRQLARELAQWDSDQSRRAGERPGIVARRFNVGQSGTLTETWTRFALSAEPKQLGDVAAFALDNDTPQALVQAIRIVLNENLVDLLVDFSVVGDQLGSVSQSKGGINISGGTVNVGGDFVGGDKIIGGDTNVVNIGAGAQVGQVAVGKDINQSAQQSDNVYRGNESTANYSSQQLSLTPKQRSDLVQVLLEVFPTRTQLTETLRFRLDRELESIALTDNSRTATEQVIDYFEKNGELARLIVAVREYYPNNARLLQFAAQFGLASTTGTRVDRMVPANTRDPQTWLARLGEYEPRVCQIEIADPNASQPMMLGTGFLVGPDLLFTVYQLVEPLIQRESDPTRAAFRFDYKALNENTPINPGTVYRLAKDWLVDFSPYSRAGTVGKNAEEELPKPDELDYALLRLEGAPGANPIGGERAEYSSNIRGWIEMPMQPTQIEPDAPSVLLHYPQAGPLRLSIENKGVVGFNANKTRVEYRAPSQNGSAGAPLFDKDWNILAIHEGRAPARKGMRGEPLKQGVPISSILDLLEKRDKKYLLYRALP